MTPMTKSIFLCDDAVEDPVSKKVSVLNIFNAIRFPDGDVRINVFACWRAGHGRARTRIEMHRAGSTDWELLARTSDYVLDFQNPLETKYSLY